jgi:hypothetical protein
MRNSAQLFRTARLKPEHIREPVILSCPLSKAGAPVRKRRSHAVRLSRTGTSRPFRQAIGKRYVGAIRIPALCLFRHAQANSDRRLEIVPLYHAEATYDAC